MNNSLVGNLLTFHTLRWIYSSHELEFMAVKQPSDIEALINRVLEIEDGDVAFKKGALLRNDEALFDWVVDARGYYLTINDMAPMLLEFLIEGRKKMYEALRDRESGQEPLPMAQASL